MHEVLGCVTPMVNGVEHMLGSMHGGSEVPWVAVGSLPRIMTVPGHWRAPGSRSHSCTPGQPLPTGTHRCLPTATNDQTNVE